VNNRLSRRIGSRERRPAGDRHRTDAEGRLCGFSPPVARASRQAFRRRRSVCNRSS
jgi:hypothetical protein